MTYGPTNHIEQAIKYARSFKWSYYLGIEEQFLLYKNVAINFVNVYFMITVNVFSFS